jgi:ubiquinone biosynthesis protein
MLVCEGVGRLLNPEVNMWALARPLIEEWMWQNRGVEARARTAVEAVLARIEELPNFIVNLEKTAAMMAEGGVRLHPDTLAALGGNRRVGVFWPVLTAILVAALVLALVL